MNYTNFHGQPFLFINEDAGEFNKPAETKEVDLTMHYRTVGEVIHCRFFNKDESEAELCGNALLGLMQEKGKGAYIFQIKAGKLEGINTGKELRLGMMETNVSQLKKQDTIRNRNGVITVDRITDILIWEIDIGNKHLAIMSDDLRGIQHELLKTYNLHYITEAHIETNTFEVRCFERGVGETQACGSGAYAVGSAMMQHFNLEEVNIEMKGGKYTVKPQTLIVKI